MLFFFWTDCKLIQQFSKQKYNAIKLLLSSAAEFSLISKIATLCDDDDDDDA